MSSKRGEGKKSAQTKKKTLSKRDHRDNQRVSIQMLVDYKSNGHYLFDFCRDLGTGGVFIETAEPLETGADIDLVFTLPDSNETLETRGRVIWVQEEVADQKLVSGMGVQFTSFSHENRKLLEKFVDRYHGAGYGRTNEKSAS